MSYIDYRNWTITDSAGRTSCFDDFSNDGQGNWFRNGVHVSAETKYLLNKLQAGRDERSKGMKTPLMSDDTHVYYEDWHRNGNITRKWWSMPPGEGGFCANKEQEKLLEAEWQRRQSTEEKTTVVEAEKKYPFQRDDVAHYTTGGTETIDFIFEKLGYEGGMAYIIGNLIKYSSRANHKGQRKSDINKIRNYSVIALEKMAEEGDVD